MEQVMARGPNFVYAKQYIQKEYGKELWNRALNNLQQDVKETWEES